MSVYENLDLLIRENIKQNNAQQITGVILQETLLEMVKTLGQPEDILWSDLRDLKTAKGLVPGRLYRIIDYVTTTTQVNTQSAGHPFDVIVLALSKNTLSEQAWAIQHEGDTYFSNRNLSAWKIWYSIDNDAERFNWADAGHGKGVIYRMIDEHNNDCPYDFKNIQFLTPELTYVYTFNSPNGDFSLDTACYSNTIEPYFTSFGGGVLMCLGHNYFTGGQLCKHNWLRRGCMGNTFRYRAVNNILGFNCELNTFDYNFMDNVIGDRCTGLVMEHDVSKNKIGGFCTNIKIGSLSSYNVIGDNVYELEVGNNFNHNIVGSYSKELYLGNSCSKNIIGSNVSHLYAGDQFYANIIGDCSEYIYFKDSEEGLIHYVRWITIGGYCNQIHFVNDATASSSLRVQYYEVEPGIRGSSSSPIVLNPIRNNQVRYTIAINSNREVKQFCLADLIQ